MEKATLGSLITPTAKRGFQRAGRVLFGNDRSMAAVLTRVGEILNSQVDDLESNAEGKIPAEASIELICRLEPKKIAPSAGTLEARAENALPV